MFAHLNPSSGMPIYRQLFQQLRQRIVSGQMASGEQMPSVRELSADLKINFLTVAKVYQLLEGEALPKMKGGLRALYRTLELPGANPLKDAHTALDTAVLTAYGFNAKKDLLAQLLALNQEVATKIERGEPVMPPGVPKNYSDAKKLVSEDCIKPAP